MANPWFKFSPSSWRSDPKLQMCSAGARGLWIEMLCLMHDANPRGELRVNGNPINARQLASLTGIPSEEVIELTAELEASGVFSRDEDGAIISRRMIRDEEKAARDKANGRKGGNPKIVGKPTERVDAGVNPNSNRQDKAKSKEVRVKNITTLPDGEISTDDVVRRMPELYSALGVTDETKSPGLLSFAEPIQWVQGGCDIDADIIPTLRSIAARGKTPNGWRYCTNAVFEARDRRLMPTPAPRPRSAPARRVGVVEAYRNGFEEKSSEQGGRTIDHRDAERIPANQSGLRGLIADAGKAVEWPE